MNNNGSNPTRAPRKRMLLWKRLRKGFSNIFLCGLSVPSSRVLEEAAVEHVPPIPANPPQLTLSLPEIDLSPIPLLPQDTNTTQPKADQPVLNKKPSLQRTQGTNTPSSIHNLPPEILSEVFSMAFFTEIPNTIAAKRTRTTPLTLSKICGSWRELIFSTPHLWSWVSLVISKRRYTKQLDLLQEWLDRVSHYPLTIDLCFDNESDWTKDPPSQAISLLLRRSDQWRSIDMTLPEACHEEISPFKDKFPILEHASLQPLISDCNIPQSDRKRLDIFGVVPKLSFLQLNGYYVEDCAIPWAQLHELVLQHIYLDECFYTLGRAGNLVHCKLSTMLVNKFNRPVEKKPLKLPMLESLKMQGASGDDQATLISQLDVPLLSHFLISSANATVAFPSITDMFTRSRCVLKILTLEGFGLDEDKLIDMLRELFTVEQLRLEPLRTSTKLSDVFLEALTDSEQQSTAHKSLLPYLQQLEITAEVRFTAKALLKMLKFRRAKDGDADPLPTSSKSWMRRMESVKLCTTTMTWGRLKEFQKELEELKEDGMGLELLSLNHHGMPV